MKPNRKSTNNRFNKSRQKVSVNQLKKLVGPPVKGLQNTGGNQVNLFTEQEHANEDLMIGIDPVSFIMS